MQKKLAVAALLVLIFLSACGKKVDDRPAAKPLAPLSKGPSGPPVISQPNQPQPK